MPLINPDTGSEIEVEADGDFTVTFEMTLPQPADGGAHRPPDR